MLVYPRITVVADCLSKYLPILLGDSELCKYGKVEGSGVLLSNINNSNNNSIKV